MNLRVLTASLLAVLVAGCTSSTDEPGSKEPAPSAATSTAQEQADDATTSAPAEIPRRPVPRVGQCRDLRPRDALAPTSIRRPVRCGQPHTAETFHVGRLDLVREGHRLAVDSPNVQRQPREVCTARLREHLGASPQDMRLSLARAVWFTPTVEEAASGDDWFRCDVVVVTGDRTLVRLPRSTRGTGGNDTTTLCATHKPGNAASRRVPCSQEHAWRAVSTVDLPGKQPPSADAATAVMSQPCRAAALDRADDPLDFEWSEERPTREQWDAGQRYGICWVPV